MKTRLICLIISVIGLTAKGQDILIKKNGESLNINVSEVNTDDIVFSYENESLINRISVNEISQIQFNSGRIQNFETISKIELPYQFDILEPKFIGNIYQIDESGTIINTLEQQKSSTKSNLNASAIMFGIGSAKSKGVVNGSKSPIRVNKGKILFLAKVENSTFNPKEIFNIFPLETKTKTKKRIIEIGKSNTLGTSTTMDIDFLPFVAYPYKESSFIIEVDIQDIGEYAITLNSSRATFNMFGTE